MVFINHMIPPSPDDRYNQLRVVEGSRGPTGVLESHVNSVDCRSSHDDTYLIVTCLPHGPKMRRDISLVIQYCKHALRCACVHNKATTVWRTASHYELVSNLYILAFSHAYTSKFRERGDNTGNFGFANTGVEKPIRHL